MNLFDTRPGWDGTGRENTTRSVRTSRVDYRIPYSATRTRVYIPFTTPRQSSGCSSLDIQFDIATTAAAVLAVVVAPIDNIVSRVRCPSVPSIGLSSTRSVKIRETRSKHLDTFLLGNFHVCTLSVLLRKIFWNITSNTAWLLWLCR